MVSRKDFPGIANDFIDQCLIADEDGFISYSELHDAYRAFANAKGEKAHMRGVAMFFYSFPNVHWECRYEGNDECMGFSGIRFRQ